MFLMMMEMILMMRHDFILDLFFSSSDLFEPSLINRYEIIYNTFIDDQIIIWA